MASSFGTVFNKEFAPFHCNLNDILLSSAEVDISEFEESKTYKRELDLEKNGGRMICIFNLSRIDESSADSSCEISPDDLVNIRKTYVRLLLILLPCFYPHRFDGILISALNPIFSIISIREDGKLLPKLSKISVHRPKASISKS